MTTDADRERFEKMAANYRRELDAAEAEGRSSASPTASGDAVPTNDAVAAQPGGSDAAAPASGSTDDGFGCVPIEDFGLLNDFGRYQRIFAS